MMQAKFINVFGQWVHPYLFLSKIEEDSTVCMEFRGANSEKYQREELRDFIVFENKTIDEVAEEYNRQVDLINKQKLDLKIIQGDQESALFINGVESWGFEGGEIWGFTGLLKDLGYPAVTVETKK